jgi:hypothetical protein
MLFSYSQYRHHHRTGHIESGQNYIFLNKLHKGNVQSQSKKLRSHGQITH